MLVRDGEDSRTRSKTRHRGLKRRLGACHRTPYDRDAAGNREGDGALTAGRAAEDRWAAQYSARSDRTPGLRGAVRNQGLFPATKPRDCVLRPQTS